MHWEAQQKKGLTPFIILNAGPNHAVKQEKSVKSKGKKKIEWVDVDSSEEDDEERNREENFGNEQVLPVKIGPPRKKSTMMPAPTQDPSQIAGPSTQGKLATRPSTLYPPPTPPEHTKKKAANRKKAEATVDHNHDEVDGLTDKRTTRSSLKTHLAQIAESGKRKRGNEEEVSTGQSKRTKLASK